MDTAKLEGIGTAAAAILSAMIAYFANRKKAKKDKEDTDLKQDKELKQIKELLKSIETRLKGLEEEHKESHDLISHLYKTDTFKSYLKESIMTKSNQIIRANPDLDQAIISLLISGRDSTIKYAKEVYFSQLLPEIKFYEMESSNIFDNLKLVVNTYFTDVKIVCIANDEEHYTFAEYLRHCSEIKRHSTSMIDSLYTLMKNRAKYNGGFTDKFIDVFVTFIENVYADAIIAYRNFKNLKSI